jgi:hypothetical protein
MATETETDLRFKPVDTYIMRTTAMKPYKQSDGREMTHRFLAGMKYVIDEKDFPEIRQWLQCGYCYRANDKMPQTPIYVPPFISSKQDAATVAEADQRLATAVAAGVKAAIEELFTNPSLFDRLRRAFNGGKEQPGRDQGEQGKKQT